MEIDASGDIVIPGLINTHTHVSMAILKGIADDLPFPKFLDKVFAVDAKRTDGTSRPAPCRAAWR